ncbi:TPA: fimbrial protein [Serratia fonticola]|uniref:fimbrial protein n=1 Tax=Serratia fonticola TaxID=47917 RepID=UPI00217999ED|nr:fimbrial protein [Serratia fonticola]CAI1221114.1 PAP fimbrial minor pilin protein precursor [Serratia fonticola]CAI2497372.1 PAP fimbrial minor pilin protein precursor [Serratia fonticola]
MAHKSIWPVFALGLAGMTPSFSASAAVTLKVQGSIVETACAIDLGNRDQTIDMGSLSISHLLRDGQGAARPFTIRLVNCSLEKQQGNRPDWQYFRITFDGPHERGLFKVSGQAKGVGLEIRDQDNKLSVPGSAMSPQQLTAGTHDLIYRLRLIANQQPLAAGKYNSQLAFKLDYE